VELIIGAGIVIIKQTNKKKRLPCQHNPHHGLGLQHGHHLVLFGVAGQQWLEA
jgi:hypothetical protein